jgi:dipeptidyl aminopeptidase/acylaminoacyl peptidase
MRKVIYLAFSLAVMFSGRPSLGDETKTLKPFTPKEIAAIDVVREPAISPDGKWVAYKITRTRFERNRRHSQILVVPATGGESEAVTSGLGGDGHPTWTSDGTRLLFLSGRSGSKQLWMVPWNRGGEAIQLTDFPGGLNNYMVTPDGTGLVFAARTLLSCGADTKCITKADRKQRRKQRKISALVHEHLLYRHWDTYRDDKVQHLFYQPLRFDGQIEAGTVRDLTPTMEHDVLCFWLLSAGQDFVLSPDSKWLYFSGTQEQDQAVSYNHQIFRVPLAGGEVETMTDNPASDMLPRISPDGRLLAWRSSKRPGYESDRYELMLMDIKSREVTSLTADFDRSVGNLFWGHKGKLLYFEAENQGNVDLYSVSRKGGRPEPVMNTDKTGRGYHLGARLSRRGDFFVYLYRTINQMYEVYRCKTDGSRPQALTAANKEIYDTVYVPPMAEEVWFNGVDKTPVQGFVIKPMNYESGKKYPLMVRIHGGPQQMFGYAFRYEFAVFASHGYFVFFCNPRGSTGYGQAFTDGVRGDWGGKPIDDLKAGVRHVLDTYTDIDARRVGAWGGSYGGYVVNWLQGHNDDKLFTAFVSHAGGADRWSAYGTTEELWFPEWEMFGPPWENPELMDKLSPIRYAKHFATPQLITHGDLDFRVRVTGGEAMFTALQRQKVPSKMIRFPDENHWIMKPENQRYWYAEILSWFDHWLKPHAE